MTLRLLQTYMKLTSEGSVAVCLPTMGHSGSRRQANQEPWSQIIKS